MTEYILVSTHHSVPTYDSYGILGLHPKTSIIPPSPYIIHHPNIRTSITSDYGVVGDIGGTLHLRMLIIIGEIE